MLADSGGGVPRPSAERRLTAELALPLGSAPAGKFFRITDDVR